MRILFISDLVGSLGREQVEIYLPKLKQKYHVQLTIVNVENAAADKGITVKIYKQLFTAGVDCLTIGNHTFDKNEVFDFIEDVHTMIPPANYPEGSPGK